MVSIEEILFFLLGCMVGLVFAIIASKRGPVVILASLILFSIPLFTIGPHPTILGLFVPLALLLIRMMFLVLRNPEHALNAWKMYSKQ
jgi:hypothetical protein